MSRVGVIDCGSNTFNLFIADVQATGWKTVFKATIPVFLLKDSLPNVLHPDRLARGLDALKSFKENLVNYDCETILACGTEALRSKESGLSFQEIVFECFGIRLDIIDGIQESNLVSKAIQPLLYDTLPALAMDIGGGSIEFSYIEAGESLYHWSFPIGIANLLLIEELNNPINENDKRKIEAFIHPALTEIKNTLKQYKPEVLIGMAGVFDSIYSIINHGQSQNNQTDLRPIAMDSLERLTTRLYSSNKEDRSHMPGLVTFRAETIVPALVILNETLRFFKINQVYSTPRSLTEGILIDYLEKNKRE